MEAAQSTWAAPPVVPHDDAYAILSLVNTPFLVPVLQKYLQEAEAACSRQILEPLLALIVDHSRRPDLFWPTMLSALISAGVLDYFYRVATLPLPNLAHAQYRNTSEAKRDALTGILRCLEQIHAADYQMVSEGLILTLRDLGMDVTQPIMIQNLAHAASLTWIYQSRLAAHVQNTHDTAQTLPMISCTSTGTCLLAIAEDNPDARRILETYLTCIGYCCVWVCDGGQAISKALGDISKVNGSCIAPNR